MYIRIFLFFGILFYIHAQSKIIFNIIRQIMSYHIGLTSYDPDPIVIISGTPPVNTVFNLSNSLSGTNVKIFFFNLTNIF